MSGPENRDDAGRQQQQQQGQDRVQGEGDYDAARRYDKAAREFAQSGQVDEAARQARPADAEQADELRRAEREGQSHAKGEDPLLDRPGGMPKP